MTNVMRRFSGLFSYCCSIVICRRLRLLDANSMFPKARIFKNGYTSRFILEGTKMNKLLVTIATAILCSTVFAQEDLGNLSTNPYAPDSISNPYGAGNPYDRNSVNNPYGRYGSPYSNQSTTNPYATDAPKLYDQQGNYRGRLSTNPYDRDSTSNPYGRYGSPYSRDSINNPYGAGNPYKRDSPTNPYGTGWEIRSSDDPD